MHLVNQLDQLDLQWNALLWLDHSLFWTDGDSCDSSKNCKT